LLIIFEKNRKDVLSSTYERDEMSPILHPKVVNDFIYKYNTILSLLRYLEGLSGSIANKRFSSRSSSTSWDWDRKP